MTSGGPGGICRRGRLSPLGRIGGHVDAGVIPLQNLVVALPLLGQGVGAVLAHAHAVAVAGDGEGDPRLRLKYQGMKM